MVRCLKRISEENAITKPPNHPNYLSDLLTAYPEDYDYSMTLESLVVSHDWQEVSVVECILGGMQIGVAVESDLAKARRYLSRTKVDAIIVDYDVEGSHAFVNGLDRLRAYRDAFPLIVMGGRGHHDELRNSGADYFFDKPISVEQAVHTLAAARNKILHGRLRYHRQELQAPVAIFINGKQIGGELLNVSQGGIGVYTSSELPMGETLQLGFSMPGRETEVNAKAKVAWKNEKGQSGLRFEEIAEKDQQDLQMWLAGRYFEN